MKRFTMLAAAVVATVAITGTAEAGPGNKGNSGGIKSGGFKPSSGPSFPSGGIKVNGGGIKVNGGGIKTTVVPKSPLKHGPFKPTHVSGHGHKGKFDYHVKFGKSFSHGFCYHGKHHCHWSYSCYWPKYGCNAYWCPSACCYYYWSEPACCYYPISYIAVAPPVQIVIQTTPAPLVVSGPVGGPPAGIPGLPE